MFGLSQHLFAKQPFDLVMTSGNVFSFFFQRVGGSELRALAGGGGGQSGDAGKKEKKGRHRMRNSERGAAPMF